MDHGDKINPILNQFRPLVTEEKNKEQLASAHAVITEMGFVCGEIESKTYEQWMYDVYEATPDMFPDNAIDTEYCKFED